MRSFWTIFGIMILISLIAANLYRSDLHKEIDNKSSGDSTESNPVHQTDSQTSIPLIRQWEKVSELQVNGRTINTGELRIYLEQVVGNPHSEKTEMSNGYKHWICSYSVEGREIEVTYAKSPDTGTMWALEIRVR